MKTADCRILVLVTLVLATACNGRGLTSPTPAAMSSSPPVGPIPPPLGPVVSFEMAGLVTDNEGRPVSGATVTVWHDAFVDSSVVVTDPSGRYSVRFSSARGSNAGPPGTELSVGMALIEAPGYDWYARYIVTPTEQFVENFHLHRIHRITRG